MNTLTASSLTSALDTYRDLLASDILAEETWRDIVETTTNDVVDDLPSTQQFFYVLDTANLSLGEIVERAAEYQHRLDAFEASIDAEGVDPDSVRSWDVFEAAVGEGTWGAMPVGVTVVVNDRVESYAYSSISAFAAEHQLIVVA